MEFKPKRITQHLSSPKAAVRCTHAYRSKRYVLLTGQPDSIVVLKAGCPIVALNDDEMVVSKDGEPVNPTGRFYITADTIDPYHYLFDIFLRTHLSAGRRMAQWVGRRPGRKSAGCIMLAKAALKTSLHTGSARMVSRTSIAGEQKNQSARW
jgi:hypothetical protein